MIQQVRRYADELRREIERAQAGPDVRHHSTHGDARRAGGGGLLNFNRRAAA